MLLNVGCGEHYAQGWVNTDIHRQGPKPDVICNVLALPFADHTAERIYIGHVLEHIHRENLSHALAEVRRVLAADGEVMIVGPDVGLTAKHEPILLAGVRYGGCRWPGDEHRWFSTGGETLRHVRATGFVAHLIPVETVPSGWPIVDRALWQFAITARPFNPGEP
jgi:predicted SAM-dependent methyltransferase